MTSKKDSARNSGLISLDSRDSMWMAKNMGKESSLGLTGRPMTVNGPTTRCMGWEYSCGLMEEHTKESILMTKSMGLECLLGQMGGDTKATGRTGNRCEVEMKALVVYQELKARDQTCMLPSDLN